MHGRELRINLLTGLVIGVGLGVMATLVFAPKKLKRDLARKGRVAAHRASETAEVLRDKGLDFYERAKDRVG